MIYRDALQVAAIMLEADSTGDVKCPSCTSALFNDAIKAWPEHAATFTQIWETTFKRELSDD